MKIENKVIGISILLGLLTGVTDTVIDYFMFYEKPFWDLLIFDIPKFEIYSRSLILIAFTLSGFIVSKIIAKQRKAEQKIIQQNDFLNLVIDSLKHPFCVIDAVDYTIKIANSAIGLEQQSGNSTCYAITHKSDTPCNSVEHPCPMEIIKKTKKPVTLEHIHYDKDGIPKNVEVHAHPILDSNGNVSQVIEYSIDITERKRAEEFLRETEKKYRILFESSRDAIMTLTPPTWLFTSGNPATVKLFRVRDEAEFISLGPWQLSPERQPDDKPSDEKAKEMIETAMLNGSHFFEWTHCHSDGTPFPAEVLLTRMEQRGQVLLQATVRDITDRKQAEEERNRLILDLQKALVEVKTLSGFLPICSYCKKIRDDKGYWNQIESYIRDHSKAEFSHSICQECAKKHYPDMDIYDDLTVYFKPAKI